MKKMAPKCLQDEKLHVINIGMNSDCPSSPRNGNSYSHSLRSRLGHNSTGVAVVDVDCDQDSDGNDHGIHNKRKNRPLNHSAICSAVFMTVKQFMTSPHELIRSVFASRWGRIFCALTLLCLVYSKRILQIYHRLFGQYSITGGRYGAKLDAYMVERAVKAGYLKKKPVYDYIGIELPTVDMVRHDAVLDLKTKVSLREMLLRREDRMVVLSQLENSAEEFERSCLFNEGNGLIQHIEHVFHRKHHLGIPSVLFVPEVALWLPPRPHAMEGYFRIPYTDIEMRELFQDSFERLLDTFDSLTTTNDRVQMWALAVLYQNGGVYLGSRASITLDPFEEFNKVASEGLADHLESWSTCTAPVGIAVFEAKDDTSDSQETSLEIAMLAATPRHPHFRCVLDILEKLRGLNASTILNSFFLHDSWEANGFLTINNSTSANPNWQQLTTSCPSGRSQIKNCCSSTIVHDIDHIPTAPLILSNQDVQSEMFLQVSRTKRRKPLISRDSVPTTVTVREKYGTNKPVSEKKNPLDKIMKERNIEPGWFCSRCLKAPSFGSLEKCSAICPSGYEEFLCRAEDDPAKELVVVEIDVKTNWQAVDSNAKRIPRIIHQTFFEGITYDRYPNMQRLRNSWINSGWEYRFYSDEDARRFIVENYPERFLSAFDAIIPGAFKVRFCRCDVRPRCVH